MSSASRRISNRALFAPRTDAVVPGLALGYGCSMSVRFAEPIHSLYVHVPFCAHKCEYCAFYSHPARGDLIDRYVGALTQEIELTAPDLHSSTIFFGGGTSSLLNLRQWEKVLRALEQGHLLGAAEWTVECNPATVSLDKAKLLRSF